MGCQHFLLFLDSTQQAGALSLELTNFLFSPGQANRSTTAQTAPASYLNQQGDQVANHSHQDNPGLVDDHGSDHTQDQNDPGVRIA
jgi:hypothetical protein